jgi:hypothetical protein
MAKQWTYGDAWEHYPIEPGEVWGVPSMGSMVAVHNLFERLPAWMKHADMLFVDPPWNRGNVNSFYTKAGRSDYITDFADFEHALFERIDDLAPHVCYMEVGKQAVDRWATQLAARYAAVQVFSVTYYRKHPCYILRGGSAPTEQDYTGRDEADVIAAVACDEEYAVLGDFCMGRGLVGMAAYRAGKPFVGTELNKRRLAVLLQKLALAGASVSKYKGAEHARG